MKLADCYCEVKIRRECEEILMRNINDKNAFLLLQNAAAANVLVPDFLSNLSSHGSHNNFISNSELFSF